MFPATAHTIRYAMVPKMNPAGDAAGGAVKGAAMPIDLICLDADDTLWHNMRFFAAAEDAFVAMLAPFAEAGIARDRLAAVEVLSLIHISEPTRPY